MSIKKITRKSMFFIYLTEFSFLGGEKKIKFEFLNLFFKEYFFKFLASYSTDILWEFEEITNLFSDWTTKVNRDIFEDIYAFHFFIFFSSAIYHSFFIKIYVESRKVMWIHSILRSKFSLVFFLRFFKKN